MLWFQIDEVRIDWKKYEFCVSIGVSEASDADHQLIEPDKKELPDLRAQTFSSHTYTHTHTYTRVEHPRKTRSCISALSFCGPAPNIRPTDH